MPTANATLFDKAIDHAIDLRFYSNGVVRRMIAVLNRADARLSAQLAEALLQLPADSFTVERLEALLQSVRETNAAAYRAVLAELEPELRALSALEARAEEASWRAAIPAAISERVALVGISAEQVYAAALSRPFQGRLLREWAAALPEGRMRQLREAIRAGYVEGRTTSEIITTIRGTKALRFEDGILNRARRELATIVQTAISHTAQTARQAYADANADLVTAVRWVSTLDSRTSPPCRIRDGLRYTADAKHRPIGHKIPWGDGPGRLHFNCRSVSVPVFKSWRELGIDADELPAATRASMDGQVPADMTFAQWLARQSTARQDEILGATRGALYRKGGLKLDRFYDNRGRFLSLAQLAARQP